MLRGNAARALGQIGPEAREAVPALIQVLGDEYESAGGNAARALKAITGQDFGEDAGRWQEWWDEQQ
jgi:HEAT repeat protein